MNKSIFWIGVFIAVALLLNLIKGVLSPFIIAFIFTYLLYPIVEKISINTKLPRNIVAILVFGIFTSLVIMSMVILLPIIYQQIALFILKLPDYKNYIQSNTIPYFLDRFEHLDPFIAEKVKNSIELLSSNVFSIINTILNNMWGYTMATLNIAIILLLVPIILLYFLKEWPQIINHLEKLLPLKEKNKIIEIITSINNLLSGYIRGQLNVCLILAVYYSISLYLLGVDSYLLIGILSGFLILIPFLGYLLALSIALLSGYFTFGSTIKFVYLLITYLTGYILESYFLTPKIIGGRIGLHPLWIIFAVLVAGNVFGFVGVLFAIPLAGIIKILIQNLIESYKQSRFYNS